MVYRGTLYDKKQLLNRVKKQKNIYYCYMSEKKKPGIVQFIADKRAEGKSDSEIIRSLQGAGWQMDVIMKSMHGEPIKQRSLDPILDIKKQPIRKAALYSVPIILLIILVLAATFI